MDAFKLFDKLLKEDMACTSRQKFVVIGAGLPRTGTLSMKVALTKLLNGPCYHMLNFTNEKGNSYTTKFWKKVANQEEISNEELKSFFESRGFRAAVDMPSILIYKYVYSKFD